MDIRSYRETDEAAVLKLWEACGLTRSWIDPRRDIARAVSSQPDLFLVGTIGPRVMATVIGHHDGGRGVVTYLAVDPAMRKLGFGRAMMAAVEDRLRERGCPRVNLQVRVGNNDGIGFYLAIGYSQDAILSFGRPLTGDPGNRH